MGAIVFWVLAMLESGYSKLDNAGAGLGGDLKACWLELVVLVLAKGRISDEWVGT